MAIPGCSRPPSSVIIVRIIVVVVVVVLVVVVAAVVVVAVVRRRRIRRKLTIGKVIKNSPRNNVSDHPQNRYPQSLTLSLCKLLVFVNDVPLPPEVPGGILLVAYGAQVQMA